MTTIAEHLGVPLPKAGTEEQRRAIVHQWARRWPDGRVAYCGPLGSRKPEYRTKADALSAAEEFATLPHARPQRAYLHHHHWHLTTQVEL